MAASISSNSDVTRRPGQALDADAGPTPIQGEATTASSLGEGHDVFKQQVGFNLEFRSLRAGPNVTITSDGEHIDIAATGGGGTSDVQDFTDLNDVPASYSGQGGKFVAVKADVTGLEFVAAPTGGSGVDTFLELTDTPDSFSGQSGKVVSVKSDASGLEFTTPATPGEANTSSNVGTGEGTLAKAKDGVNLPFKTIKAGTNITITNNTDDVTINASGGGSGEANTASNLGSTGEGLFAQKSGVDLQFKKLKAGTNVTLTSDTESVTIAASGSSFPTNPLSSLGITVDSDDYINTISTFGSVSGFSKWCGGVLGTNGKIYGMPAAYNAVLEIDPEVMTMSTFGSLTSDSNKWAGGILAPNGKIYGIPQSSTTILKIDTDARTVSTFGSLSGSDKWSGGVLAPNGKIYCVPRNSTQVLEINPADDTTTLFGSLSSDTNKWDGGVLAPNGKIYCIPSSATTILEIDTVNKTTRTFGSLAGSSKWCGGALAPNGKIYGVPRDSTQVLELDPSNDTITLFGSLSGTFKWFGGVLGADGRIYCIPRDVTTILVINPNTQATEVIGSLSGSGKWFGGVLGADSRVYGIPVDSTAVLSIRTYKDECHGFWGLSPYTNKF